MIPYSAQLPLRTTSAWEGFREAQVIPHRYGETGGACLQYNADRTVWVWADHPCAGIDAVLIDGQEVTNWRAAPRVDSSGHSVMAVEFDAGVEEGARVAARGRGKLSPVNGRLIESPADVVRDLITAVAGRVLPPARLDAFRSACDRAGLRVGGSLTEAVTLQRALRDVCASVGAIFAADARELCHLWPAAPPAPTARTTIAAHADIGADMVLDEIPTALTLRYGHEDGQPVASIDVEARESIALYGRRAIEVDAPWVRSPTVAAAVATRLLRHRARPSWFVSVADVLGDVRVGDGAAFDHPTIPAGGTYLVLSRNYDPQSRRGSITIEVPVAAEASVRIVRQSSMLAPEQYTSATLVRDGADYLLTLREDDQRPIAFAAVTMDGRITRTSDAAGRVRFPASEMEPGLHRFAVLTSDGRALALELLV